MVDTALAEEVAAGVPMVVEQPVKVEVVVAALVAKPLKTMGRHTLYPTAVQFTEVHDARILLCLKNISISR
tara:strand:+ start:281 stop:493 length:213 start_codon:yes stop_codon:yes gene_type:complete